MTRRREGQCLGAVGAAGRGGGLIYGQWPCSLSAGEWVVGCGKGVPAQGSVCAKAGSKEP